MARESEGSPSPPVPASETIDPSNEEVSDQWLAKRAESRERGSGQPPADDADISRRRGDEVRQNL